MKIKYYSGSFNIVNYPNCPSRWKIFEFSMFELITAAFTVGRAQRWDIFAHGPYSFYEMVYRSAMVIANIAEDSDGYIIKTPAFKALDPSEKSAVSYFLGITMTKLMADKLLDIPYLMHFEVYREDIEAVYGDIIYRDGKSRPDLIDVNRNLDAHIFEAKGRSNGFDRVAYRKAKRQAEMVESVGGIPTRLNVGVQVYFEEGKLRVRWKDPKKKSNAMRYDFISITEVVKRYYQPFFELISQPPFDFIFDDNDNYIVNLFPIDITIKIPKNITALYAQEKISAEELLQTLKTFPEKLEKNDENELRVRLNDGLLFEFGKSWIGRIKKTEE